MPEPIRPNKPLLDLPLEATTEQITHSYEQLLALFTDLCNDKNITRVSRSVMEPTSYPRLNVLLENAPAESVKQMAISLIELPRFEKWHHSLHFLEAAVEFAHYFNTIFDSIITNVKPGMIQRSLVERVLSAVRRDVADNKKFHNSDLSLYFKLDSWEFNLAFELANITARQQCSVVTENSKSRDDARLAAISGYSQLADFIRNSLQGKNSPRLIILGEAMLTLLNRFSSKHDAYYPEITVEVIQWASQALAHNSTHPRAAILARALTEARSWTKEFLPAQAPNNQILLLERKAVEAYTKFSTQSFLSSQRFFRLAIDELDTLEESMGEGAFDHYRAHLYLSFAAMYIASGDLIEAAEYHVKAGRILHTDRYKRAPEFDRWITLNRQLPPPMEGDFRGF